MQYQDGDDDDDDEADMIDCLNTTAYSAKSFVRNNGGNIYYREKARHP
jgi:hypothetical protein